MLPALPRSLRFFTLLFDATLCASACMSRQPRVASKAEFSVYFRRLFQFVSKSPIGTTLLLDLDFFFLSVRFSFCLLRLKFDCCSLDIFECRVCL